MKKFHVIVAISLVGLLVSQTSTQLPAHAEDIVTLKMTKVVVNGNSVSFKSSVSNCFGSELKPRFLGIEIGPTSESKRSFSLQQGVKQNIKILGVLPETTINPGCTPNSEVEKSFTFQVPSNITFASIYDYVSDEIVYTDPNAVTKPWQEVNFLATLDFKTGSSGVGESAVVEVNIGVDGIMKIKPIIQKKGFTYQIIAIAKDGIIVTEYSNSRDSIRTFIQFPTRQKNLSKKVIYVEPASISTDLKYLYGRRVKDAVNSTQIYRQVLSSGAVSVFFDASKKGGGFICGVVPDSTHKFGYFSHLKASATDIYRINLTNGSLSKLGTTRAGFCLDGAEPDGDLYGINVNPVSLKITNDKYFSLSTKKVSAVSEVSVAPFITMISSRAFLSFGNSAISSSLMGKLQLNDLSSDNKGSFEYDYGSSIALEQSSWFQFLSPLPMNWGS